MSVILPISFSSTLLEDGTYFNYYDGDDLDLDCGIYYLAVEINGEIWYSDLFRITDISNQSTVPQIKYKENHLALPIYDSIYKQNRFKCDEGCCGMLLNPLLNITPFFSDEVTFTNNSEVHVYLVDLNSLIEIEITAELNLDFGSQDYLYSGGGTFLIPLECGVHYLHIHTDSGDWYSETFIIKNLDNVDLSLYDVDEGIITEDTEIPIVTEDDIPIVIE